jgi:hypothetical protein
MSPLLYFSKTKAHGSALPSLEIPILLAFAREHLNDFGLDGARDHKAYNSRRYDNRTAALRTYILR